jgi:hypothetical protein
MEKIDRELVEKYVPLPFWQKAQDHRNNLSQKQTNTKQCRRSRKRWHRTTRRSTCKSPKSTSWRSGSLLLSSSTRKPSLWKSSLALLAALTATTTSTARCLPTLTPLTTTRLAVPFAPTTRK